MFHNITCYVFVVNHIIVVFSYKKEPLGRQCFLTPQSFFSIIRPWLRLQTKIMQGDSEYGKFLCVFSYFNYWIWDIQ